MLRFEPPGASSEYDAPEDYAPLCGRRHSPRSCANLPVKCQCQWSVPSQLGPIRVGISGSSEKGGGLPRWIISITYSGATAGALSESDRLSASLWPARKSPGARDCHGYLGTSAADPQWQPAALRQPQWHNHTVLGWYHPDFPFRFQFNQKGRIRVQCLDSKVRSGGCR